MPGNLKKESVLVFSAHSDDFVIGAGGLIKKYVEEGKKVISIVFSYGEKSHPWLKEEVVKELRSEETLQASRILGCKTKFFNLHEFKFWEEFSKDKVMEEDLFALVKQANPDKIFTHSPEDPHPDHQGVYKITLHLLEKLKEEKSPLNPEIYIYSIWNPVSFRSKYPAYYVDISPNFKVKMQALNTFKSQKIHIAYPVFLLFIKNLLHGLKIRKKFAEKFFRIK